MNESKAMQGESRPSEFGEVINQLDNELLKMSGNAGVISDKVVKIRDFRLPACEKGGSDEQPIPIGIIGALISIVQKMSRLNDSLSQSATGLEKFVG